LDQPISTDRSIRQNHDFLTALLWQNYGIMIAKGQNEDAQAARVAVGCCPVHGLFMSQHSPFLEREEALRFGFDGAPESVCLVHCSRKGCGIWALARGPRDIVRVIRPPESTAAEEFAERRHRQFRNFAAMIQAEGKSKRASGAELTSQELEELYALSHRKPS
jgi:hypothetical protein